MKKTNVPYMAHIEYARAVKSRAELKKMEQGFRGDKIIAENFVELKGRKFFFQFESSAARMSFLKTMEKVYARHNERTEREGW